jgi:hypothetical protein
VQYAANDYIELLNQHHVEISMAEVGKPGKTVMQSG